ncbi:DNA/RNA non-specific endonuclease [Piscinibacter sp. HJYY11]|uniref:DNA/RNA non-specific endonuclease n=1 Tax=Piscinibacter sp. HJYY11 TaxID=2801333 RepID=UPI00191FF5F2|nr:DNA/RNA non-specific endonuclease [Piscinibacter sp. HJYY11]MBL0730739.1 DNA/RNA non-specific endonuclease [Piscinibacter sp. HJYY11]
MNPSLYRAFAWLVLFAMAAGCATQTSATADRTSTALTPGKTQVDYAHVDTRDKAQALHRSGKLQRAHLFPLAAGGQDAEVNVIYIPEKSANEKARIDSEILKMAASGATVRYSAKPVYKGNSFVPSQLVISVTGAQNTQYVVDIW